MKFNDALRNRTEEFSQINRRLLIAFIGLILLSAVLLGRLFYLQYVQHDIYRKLSDKNRVDVEPVTPTRGLIYDRNGVLLAENLPSFSLTLVKERVEDLDQTLTLIDKLIPLREDQVQRFKQRLKQRRRPFESTPLLFRLSEDQIAKISVNQYFLPGVQVEAQLVRHYPLGPSIAHALGYVGRINKTELRRLDPRRYAATHHIGKIGVEKKYEDLLHGEVGSREFEANARGQVLRILNEDPPIPGANLNLYLDSQLQLAAEQSLAGRRGAVVAIEINSGGILTLYSNPSFDPNLFVLGISVKDYSALRDSLDQPLFNRALRGQYPPGSTLKPFVGLAALDTQVTTPNYRIKDPGWYQLENDERFYRDWKREGHGDRVDLHQALVESCDTYFYDIAFKMGVDRIHQYLDRFGFGRKTSIDVPDALAGLNPSRDWKRGNRGLPWFAGDTLNLGIGQGFMLTTPLQLAAATAVLAKRGAWLQPRYLKAIGDAPFTPARNDEPPVQINNPQHWQLIHDTMEDVVHSIHGTARGIGQNLNYKIAGKTGTAQVVSIKQDEEYDSEALAERNRDHALFIAFAPLKDPQIAVSVIVENGESAGGVAAPIARQIIETYLNNGRRPTAQGASEESTNSALRSG